MYPSLLNAQYYRNLRIRCSCGIKSLPAHRFRLVLVSFIPEIISILSISFWWWGRVYDQHLIGTFFPR